MASNPTASGTTVTKTAGQSTPLTSLFSYSDADNDIVSFAVRDRELGGGYLTKNGVPQTENALFDNQPISQIGQWAFVAGPAGSTSTIGFNAIDSRGAFNPSVISTVNVAAVVTHDPTASGTTVTKTAGQSTPLTSLFSYSDQDNDIVSFAVRDRELGGGYLTKNGVPQTENALFDNQPISQIGQWAFVAGPAGSTSTIGFNAIDSRGAFNPSVISTVNVAAVVTHDPTASGTTVTKTAGQSTPLTSLFSYSDADNDIVSFAVRDRELGGGYLTKNGVPQTENALFDNQPISQIGQWAFVAGPAGSTSTIGFNAIDSRGAFNPSVISTVNVAAVVTHDPTASGTTVTKTAGQSTPLTSLFSYSDLDNDIVSFAVKDRELGGGYLTNMGIRQPENTLFDNEPISQIGQWAFVAGPAGSTSTIGFNAIDSRGAFNPSVISTVNVAAVVTHDPTASGTTVTKTAGQSTPLTSLFSYSDQDNDIVSFAVKDRELGGGYLTNMGIRQPENTLFDNEPISQIGQWAFVAGPAGSTSTIGFNAIDSRGAFNPSVISTVSVAVAHDPTASGVTLTKTAGQSTPLTSLFSYSDLDSDIVSFAVKDREVGGGYLTNMGIRQPENTLFDNQPISQIGQWAFVAGPAGSTSTIGFNAIDSRGAFNPSVVSTVSVAVAHDPTASGVTLTKTAGQSTLLTSLFSYSDLDSDIVSFAVKDREVGGGYLTNMGIRQPENTLFDNQPIGQIGQWAFVAGPAGSTSTIGFNAIDSRGAFNPSVVSTVSVAAVPDTVPGDTGTTISLTAAQWQSGKINVTGLDGLSGDKDYYKVNLTAGHVYKFEGDATLDGSDTLDSVFIRLRDGSGNALPVDKAAAGATPSLTYTATAGGTYFLAVSADGAGETWKTKTGDYQVRITDVGTQSSYSFGVSNKVVGESGGSVSFTLTRTNTVGTETVYVTTWQNWNGNGDYNAGDYTPKVGANVTFLDGSATSAPITISITPDSNPEATQTFGLIATKTPNGTLSDAVATTSFTISDDDSVVPPVGALWTGTAQQIFSLADGQLSFMAKLSDAAYGQTVATASFNAIDHHLHLLNSDGRQDVNGLNLVNGMYVSDNAEALIGQSEDALFIAFRGTEGSFLISPDWKDNLLNMDRHYAHFQPLFSALNLYVQNHPAIQHVYVSGHSLGAAMAVAFLDDPSTSYPLLFLRPTDTVTFGNPGYEDSSGHLRGSPIVNVGVESDPVWNLHYSPGRFAPGDFNTIHGDLHGDLSISVIESHAMGLYISYSELAEEAGIDVTQLKSRDYDSIIANALVLNNGTAYSAGAGDDSSALFGGDPLVGRSARDIILGGAGNDELYAGMFASGLGFIGDRADDRLYGGVGDDTYYFYTNSGSDTVEDSSGNDKIVLAAGITISDISRRSDGSVSISYGANGVQLSHITIVNFGAHRDGVVQIQIGNGAPSAVIDLLSSRDHLVDFNAASSTTQSLGSTLNAAAVTGFSVVTNLFNNTLQFLSSLNPFANSATADSTGASINETIDGTTQTISGFSNLVGTELGDRLIGDDQDNIIDGGPGGDRIEGGNGNDTLTGDAGDDLVLAGGGNDTIIGGSGAGDDTYNGGDGIDTVIYSSATLGIVVNLSASQNHATGPEIGTDQIINIENVIGGSGDDQITGNSFANRLTGGLGMDILDGGPGIDTAVFSGLRSAYTLTRSGTTLTVSGPDGTDTLTKIERLAFDDVTIPSGLGLVHNDFNIDGATDLLWRSESGQTGLWLMQNGQRVGATDLGTVPTTWHVDGADDFNGDGTSDLLWRSNDGQTGIWLMQNGQRAGAVDLGTIPSSWHVAGTGDFNSDGTSDILWRSDSGDTGIWLMQNGQRVGAADLGNIPTNWHADHVGDFNGDGTADILWRSNSGDTGTWLMQNGHRAGAADLGNIPTSWHVGNVGDFNGDGTTDLLWRSDSGQTGIWLMQNGQRAGAVDLGTIPTSWHVDYVGDFNSDGTSDLLWRNDSGQTGLWLMNNGQRVGAVDLGTIPATWHTVDHHYDLF